ncbi:class II aldolase/adducin family protein [Thermodesulfovibrionales bacterium]|nr:class II aldolase/adducin family protein [Thermodesulfovibrionales bacterium]MCL0074956.1 class II aldolase/adducin family protein [Thermodesulfovibrionales bacterium]
MAPNRKFIDTFEGISELSSFDPPSLTHMARAPRNEDDVIKILSETGKAVVKHRLVDSYFGNISYVYRDKIYISQTGSSMDELQHCIDAVALNGSSSVGITASSELSAHKNIYYETGDTAILHGHPKFSVIMSMCCFWMDCRHYKDRDRCHQECEKKRSISGIPVVSGEIGTGPTGLMHTVPAAMKEGKGVIVYGHGVFTSGQNDFLRPFEMLIDIETTCRNEYFRLATSLLS